MPKKTKAQIRKQRLVNLKKARMVLRRKRVRKRK